MWREEERVPAVDEVNEGEETAVERRLRMGPGERWRHQGKGREHAQEHCAEHPREENLAKMQNSDSGKKKKAEVKAKVRREEATYRSGADGRGERGE